MRSKPVFQLESSEGLSNGQIRFTAIGKAPIESTIGALVLMPGNDLLSHGETPHYHRRCSVSLLSSGWDQVGPERYGCQAIRL